MQVDIEERRRAAEAFERAPLPLPGVGWRFGPYRLEAGMLRRDGAMVELTPKEIGVLAVLLEARGAVVGADTLLDRVWGNAPVGSSSLHRCVSTLRSRLAEGVPGRAAIETLHRRGYRFALPVQPIRPEADTGAVARAMELVLQAHEFVGHRTPSHMALAQKALHKALELDAGCLPAWQMLGHICAAEAMRGYRPPRLAGQRAQEAARAALALAPEEAEALAVDGWVRVAIDGDAEGLHMLDAAQARAPENRMVLFYRGFALCALGRTQAGSAAVGEALALQPLAPGIAAAHGYLLLCAGETTQALTMLRNATRDMPVNHIIFAALSVVAAMAGAHAEAIAAGETACRLSDRVGLDLACLGYALARGGRRAEAEAVLAEALQAPQRAPATHIAALQAVLGKGAAARAALDQAEAEGCPYRGLVPFDPRFASLRADLPRRR